MRDALLDPPLLPMMLRARIASNVPVASISTLFTPFIVSAAKSQKCPGLARRSSSSFSCEMELFKRSSSSSVMRSTSASSFCRPYAGWSKSRISCSFSSDIIDTWWSNWAIRTTSGSSCGCAATFSTCDRSPFSAEDNDVAVSLRLRFALDVERERTRVRMRLAAFTAAKPPIALPERDFGRTGEYMWTGVWESGEELGKTVALRNQF